MQSAEPTGAAITVALPACGCFRHRGRMCRAGRGLVLRVPPAQASRRVDRARSVCGRPRGGGLGERGCPSR